jgi:hypothetical protein
MRMMRKKKKATKKKKWNNLCEWGHSFKGITSKNGKIFLSFEYETNK